MKVLSLFDGISCGQLALNRQKIKYEKYWASEISKDCVDIAKFHFPETCSLGDVSRLVSPPNADLLIGGSPCQGFSFAGKQLNFDDPRSKLFFEFVRVLEKIKPRFFLFENVKMKHEHVKAISSYLGVQPVEICSSQFSKQQRKRLYWTNIPIPSLVGKIGPNFDGYLYRLGHGYINDQLKFYHKYPCLAAQSPGTKYRIVIDFEKAVGAPLRSLRTGPLTRVATPEECEEFQTIPCGYTSKMSKYARYKAIGNGWTVSVISHILGGIEGT